MRRSQCGFSATHRSRMLVSQPRGEAHRQSETGEGPPCSPRPTFAVVPAPRSRRPQQTDDFQKNAPGAALLHNRLRPKNKAPPRNTPLWTPQRMQACRPSLVPATPSRIIKLSKRWAHSYRRLVQLHEGGRNEQRREPSPDLRPFPCQTLRRELARAAYAFQALCRQITGPRSASKSMLVSSSHDGSRSTVQPADRSSGSLQRRACKD